MIVIALFLFSTITMAKEPPRNSVEALVFKAWDQINPNQGVTSPFKLWHERITPPFPDSWPPQRGNTFSHYAFAYRLGRGLSDAEYQAAPWARIRVKGPEDAMPQLELLAKRIEELGTQGVRPLRQAEISIYKGGEALKASLMNLNAAPDRKLASQLRVYYCQWLKHNGRISSQIIPNHKSFVNWLACR